MLDERGFLQGLVFSDVCLRIVFSLIVCGGAGFVGVLTLCTLAAITINNYSEIFLGDSFVGAVEFSLLSGGDLCIIDGCLVHEVLVDDYGAVFKIVSLGK